MQNFEFEGKTAEEAIENARNELNLSRDEMEIEIIEPGSAGIFGLVGGRRARIKVRITDDIPNLEDDERGLSIAKETLENILALIPMEGITVTAEQTDGTIAVALNVNVTYVASPQAGDRLRAEANRTSRTRKTAAYDIKVTNQDGALVASCQALAYRTGKPIPFL